MVYVYNGKGTLSFEYGGTKNSLNLVKFKESFINL